MLIALATAPVSRKSLICSATCSATFSCASAVAAPRCGVQTTLSNVNSGDFGGRFDFEHIQRGAGDVTGVDCVGQRGLVDQAAAGAVDDADALVGFASASRDKMLRSRRSVACAA